MILNVVFGLLALISLFCYLYALFKIRGDYKKYEVIFNKADELKNNNNSKGFAKEQLLSEGFEEALVDEILEDLFL